MHLRVPWLVIEVQLNWDWDIIGIGGTILVDYVILLRILSPVTFVGGVRNS